MANENNNLETAVIRDFIYLDVEKLYSFYSQVFRGIANQIIRSYLSEALDRNIHKGMPLSGEEIEQQVTEMSHRTESIVLHDYMYNRLEEKLAPAILRAEELSDKWFDELNDSFLVKAEGIAEIEDYSRLKTFTKQYNTLGETIAYSSALSDEEYQETLRGLEESLEGRGKAKQRDIQAQIGHGLG